MERVLGHNGFIRVVVGEAAPAREAQRHALAAAAKVERERRLLLRGDPPEPVLPVVTPDEAVESDEADVPVEFLNILAERDLLDTLSFPDIVNAYQADN